MAVGVLSVLIDKVNLFYTLLVVLTLVPAKIVCRRNVCASLLYHTLCIKKNIVRVLRVCFTHTQYERYRIASWIACKVCTHLGLAYLLGYGVFILRSTLFFCLCLCTLVCVFFVFVRFGISSRIIQSTAAAPSSASCRVLHS